MLLHAAFTDQLLWNSRPMVESPLDDIKRTNSRELSTARMRGTIRVLLGTEDAARRCNTSLMTAHPSSPPRKEDERSRLR